MNNNRFLLLSYMLCIVVHQAPPEIVTMQLNPADNQLDVNSDHDTSEERDVLGDLQSVRQPVRRARHRTTSRVCTGPVIALPQMLEPMVSFRGKLSSLFLHAIYCQLDIEVNTESLIQEYYQDDAALDPEAKYKQIRHDPSKEECGKAVRAVLIFYIQNYKSHFIEVLSSYFDEVLQDLASLQDADSDSDRNTLYALASVIKELKDMCSNDLTQIATLAESDKGDLMMVNKAIMFGNQITDSETSNAFVDRFEALCTLINESQYCKLKELEHLCDSISSSNMVNDPQLLHFTQEGYLELPKLQRLCVLMQAALQRVYNITKLTQEETNKQMSIGRDRINVLYKVLISIKDSVDSFAVALHLKELLSIRLDFPIIEA